MRFYANDRPNSIVVLMVSDVRPKISLTKRRMPKWACALAAFVGTLQKESSPEGGAFTVTRRMRDRFANCHPGLNLAEKNLSHIVSHRYL